MKEQGKSTESGTPESVLPQILAASQISRLERVRRATRVRELAGELGVLVPEMNDTQRQSFSELLGLVRVEHTEACENQLQHIEAENTAETLINITRELEKLQLANENMQAIALRIQAKQAQSIRIPVPKAVKSMLVRITPRLRTSNNKG